MVVVCPQCHTFWTPGVGEPGCVDPTHAHVEHEVHRHRDVVVLPSGADVVAVSFHTADPYARDETPDFGLYLDGRWQPPWPHAHVDWPDFGVPADEQALVAALREVVHRAQAGQRVEVGCLGGHGRTGTALACLAVLGGVPAGEAVAWVRARYCDKAVETDDQAAFVARLSTGEAGR